MNVDQLVSEIVEEVLSEVPLPGLIWQVMPIDSMNDGSYRLGYVSSEPIPRVRVAFFSAASGASAAVVGRGMAELRRDDLARMVRQVIQQMEAAAAG